jgi:hypothetical protein
MKNTLHIRRRIGRFVAGIRNGRAGARTFCLLIAAAVAVSCSKGNDELYISALSNKEDANGIRTVQDGARTLEVKESDIREGNLSEVMTIESVVYLENTVPVGRVDKLLLYRDLLCVFDRSITNTVHLFDRQGRYLKTIGRQGEGPGEYRKIHDVQINPYTNLIEIWDGTNQQIFSYDEQGNLLQERKVDIFAGAFGVIDSAAYIFYKGNASFDPSLDYKLIAVDAGRQEVNGKLFPVQGAERQFSVQDPNIVLNYNAANGKYYFTRLFDDHIYSIRDRQLTVDYFVDFGRRAVDINQINFNQDKNKIIQDWILNPDYFTLLGSIMETADHLSFAFTKGGQVINAFHRKEQNRTYYFENLKNDITGTAAPMPLNADADGNVYFADEPGMYIAAVQSFAEYNNLSEADVLEQWRTEKPLGYEIYNRISEFDNPVILVGRYIF